MTTSSRQLSIAAIQPMSSRAPMERQELRRSPTSVASPPAANYNYSDNNHASSSSAMGGAKQVTPPPPPGGGAPGNRSKSKKAGGGGGGGSVSNSNNARGNPDMVVDGRVLDELLLVCSVIGSTTVRNDPITGAAREEFVPVTDCLNWLQDLQRALRRDHETYRPVSLKLGQWKVVSQKLLPLVIGCRYDAAMVLTVCKILVILTKPLSEAAKNAGRMTVDVRSGKVDERVIQEQILLRENAIEQSDLLMEYKQLFVKHPSHHYAFKNNRGGMGEGQEKKNASNGGGSGGGGTGLLSIFTSLLAEPLSKTGSSRTSSDHLTIELVLHLIRNLLCISPLNTFGSTEKSQYASQLHRELLVVLQEEMVLDVLVCVGQEVERRENSGYNLLLMEIVSCLLKGQDPSDVARWNDCETSAPSLSAPINIVDRKKAITRVVRTTTTSRTCASGQDSLKSRLASERQRLQLSTSSRHSHFGGTLLISKPGGKQSYVSASDYLANRSTVTNFSGGGAKGNASAAAAGQPARRKNKKAEVFVGSGRSSALHSGASATSSREVVGPSARRAKLALNSFCAKFVRDCYGPVMKSLKNEFRRESNRLEDGDRTMFFRIVWFFHQWWRVGKEQQLKKNAFEKKELKKIGEKSKEEVDGGGLKDADENANSGESSTHNLIFTMDVFMFNLVLNSTDEFFEHKKLAALAQTVALYTEMIHTLHIMYDSKDSTERMMALGLMDRLFYATEPLDRLPRLLSRWSPGVYSREYLCDLVECLHVTWKLLDSNAERCVQSLSSDEERIKRPKHAVEKMNLAASEFDKDHYFMRKFVSNQIAFMYTQLLSQYDVNAAHINCHIIAYFIRLSKFSIRNGNRDDDAEFDDALGENELATKHSTMEPMLYNIGLFTVLDRVLNDPAIRDKEDFSALLMFASSFMNRFARAAEVNPILYVEALFKHPIPHRFCELATNLYVNEELRMIAVRDLLLEDQRRYEQAEEEEAIKNGFGKAAPEKENNKAPVYEDDEEEDFEFNDDNMDEDGMTVQKKRHRKSRKTRKSNLETSTIPDDEERSSRDEEGSEVEFNEKTVDDANCTIDFQYNDDQNEAMPSEDEGCTAESKEDFTSSTEAVVAANVESTEQSPKLSGNKRIRKSLDKVDDEDSDDEDFSLGLAVPAKLNKRFIFDDDEDD